MIIVNWNAGNWLRQCLESLLQQKGHEELEIIVVDNASTDSSTDMVKNNFPMVRLIEVNRNLGFAAANNIGIKASRGEYLCFINPDVVVQNGCIGNLLAFMETHSEVGLVGPRLLNGDLTLQESWSSYPTIWSVLRYSLGVERLLGRRDTRGARKESDWESVEVLFGAFWLGRRKAVLEVGPLDERFFMYLEDVDWCRRFAAKGWKIAYVPVAEAIHYGGRSASQASKKTFLEFQRSRMLYFQKHYGRLYSDAVGLVLMLGHLGRMVLWATVYCVMSSRRPRAKELVRNFGASACWYGSYLLSGRLGK